jgi:hypothetical protein
LRRGNEMTTRSRLLMLMVLAAPFHAFATTKPLSGDLQSRIGTRDQWVEYVAKGSSIADTGYYLVAIVDLQKHTINVTARDKVMRDSLYYEFIVGNTFKAWLSFDLKWIEAEDLLQYSYQLESDTSSITKIVFFSVEWMLDCKEVLSPAGWTADGQYHWMTHEDSYKLKPGSKRDGFGLKSECPPLLGLFEIRGETIEIKGGGWNEVTWTDASGIAGENRSVSGLTIVPGPCPESIEPVDWIQRISIGLYQLLEPGYIDQPTLSTVYAILNNLKATLMHEEEQTLELLEVHVNNALSELETYHNDMEPEAYGYITENLRHMLRNKDIIHFETW